MKTVMVVGFVVGLVASYIGRDWVRIWNMWKQEWKEFRDEWKRGEKDF